MRVMTDRAVRPVERGLTVRGLVVSKKTPVDSDLSDEL
jgi:hypothetical protein